MSVFVKIIKHITALLGLLTIVNNQNNVMEGLRECSKAVRKIRKAIKNSASVGERQQLEAHLRHIKSISVQFKAEQKKGAGTRKETAKHRVHWDDSVSAFASRIRTGVISNLKHKDSTAFLIDCKAIFKRRIQNALRKDEAVKVNMAFCGEFEIAQGEKICNEQKYFTTSNSAIYRDTDIDQWFTEKVMKPIMKDLEEFQERDSGWALKAVINLGVNINKFTPQLGSSYIELPPQIKRKQACINIKNNDDACFAWSVVSALHSAKVHSDRTSSYPHYSSILKLKGIQFPMTMKQIPNFEKQNNISINVYILKKIKKNFEVLPSFLTRNRLEHHINLLLIQDIYDDESNSSVRYHYVWIKNLSRLLSRQLSKNTNKKYFCNRCLRYYRSEEQLKEHLENCIGRANVVCERCLQFFCSEDKLKIHLEDCEKVNVTAVKMPEESKKRLKFSNYKNKINAHFVIYADLESVLKATAEKTAYQEHIPAAVGYMFKCFYDDSLSFYRSYRGQDCMQWFADEMNQLAEDVSTIFMCPYDIDMTAQQEVAFKAATYCHICEEPFSPDDKKARDHNHLIPENNYRGASHEGCNINHKDTHIIPVVFHNLSGYDAHFVISHIATRIPGTIDLLPITKEKYISFTKHIDEARIQFRFIDSYRFMASSLDKLSSLLHEFPNLKSHFSNLSEEQFNLLTKKGVMPYDYFDTFDRFDETKLPPQHSFYNRLEDKPCPRRLYRRAQQVWNSFRCTTLGEYVDLYMKTDILLLADVFENFREASYKTYGLDPAHYFTLPGFAWDAMLKHTKQELELLTDIDMFLFVERGIRGGLSQVCSKRRVRANNRYMSNHDPSNPEVFIQYFDVNNQYGWSMVQALPYAGFKWADTNIDVTSIPNNSDIGYILEVDLAYPQRLHDLHKDLPFCPEHINPKTMKPPTKATESSKLMATLHSKNKYIIHYRALKQALSHGLILTKIHRVLEFKQSPWLKPYIELNTELRKKASNEFEKNLFKLMNNAVFGKTMENIRKRVNIKLVTDWFGRYGAEARIAKPEFKSATIFNENLVAIELRRLQVILNKPIYVGMSILDLAKTTIYDFHYGYMMTEFGDNCSICYTDTDSLAYEIRNQDPYESIRKDCHKYFDTSDYPPDNRFNIPLVNKKVLGLMKDENSGEILTDYVGLKSKLYAMKMAKSERDLDKLKQNLILEEYDEDEIDYLMRNYGVTKKAKGVKSSVVETKITFEDYVDCLENFKKKTASQNLIRSSKHRVYSVAQEKIALSPDDDKRYLIPGTYKTLPWGHYSIPVLMDIP